MLFSNWFQQPIRCPVAPDSKRWIEEGFQWLTQTLGPPTLLRSQFVLPTTEFFPDGFQCTPAGVENLLHRCCQYFGLPAYQMELAYYEADRPDFEIQREPGQIVPGAKVEIWIEVEVLNDPLLLMATLTRELGHALLVMQDPLLELESDHEQFSELVAIFHGCGFFLAERGLTSHNWSDGQWSGTEFQRHAYLSLDMIGYAMALYALARQDSAPQWLSFLRPDIRQAFQLGVRYIQETGDCGFLPALPQA